MEYEKIAILHGSQQAISNNPGDDSDSLFTINYSLLTSNSSLLTPNSTLITANRPQITNTLWSIVGSRCLAGSSQWSSIGLFYLLVAGMPSQEGGMVISPQLHNWYNELHVSLNLWGAGSQTSTDNQIGAERQASPERQAELRQHASFENAAILSSRNTADAADKTGKAAIVKAIEPISWQPHQDDNRQADAATGSIRPMSSPESLGMQMLYLSSGQKAGEDVAASYARRIVGSSKVGSPAVTPMPMSLLYSSGSDEGIRLPEAENTEAARVHMHPQEVRFTAVRAAYLPEAMRDLLPREYFRKLMMPPEQPAYVNGEQVSGLDHKQGSVRKANLAGKTGFDRPELEFGSEQPAAETGNVRPAAERAISGEDLFAPVQRVGDEASENKGTALGSVKEKSITRRIIEALSPSQAKKNEKAPAQQQRTRQRTAQDGVLPQDGGLPQDSKKPQDDEPGAIRPIPDDASGFAARPGEMLHARGAAGTAAAQRDAADGQIEFAARKSEDGNDALTKSKAGKLGPAGKISPVRPSGEVLQADETRLPGITGIGGIAALPEAEPMFHSAPTADAPYTPSDARSGRVRGRIKTSGEERPATERGRPIIGDKTEVLKYIEVPRMISVPTLGARTDAYSSLYYKEAETGYQTGDGVSMDAARIERAAQTALSNAHPTEYKTETNFKKVDMTINKPKGQAAYDPLTDPVQMSRLVDRVYDQLERRIIHERRRVGM